MQLWGHSLQILIKFHGSREPFLENPAIINASLNEITYSRHSKRQKYQKPTLPTTRDEWHCYKMSIFSADFPMANFCMRGPRNLRNRDTPTSWESQKCGCQFAARTSRAGRIGPEGPMDIGARIPLQGLGGISREGILDMTSFGLDCLY